MADYITLPAQVRTERGKKNKQLRRDGLTPIVVYGRHTDPVSLQADSKLLRKVLAAAGTSSVVSIEVDGEDAPRLALVRDYQRHVTKLDLMHADFLEVAMDEAVRSDVPVHVTGEPELVRANEALLDVLLTAVQVEALPADLPSSLEVDASDLAEIGSVITVADLATGRDFTILSDPEEVVARVTALRMAALEELEAEAEELEEGEVPEGEETGAGEDVDSPAEEPGEGSGD
ncbi:MAG: 50S ribosomal protein L25 [Anaerolineae bacterium]|jgi:large subunit ribosomal protein L25